MTNSKAIEILQFHAEIADPEFKDALDLAISALEKQLVDKCCETCKHKTRLLEKWRCRECYRESNREDYWEPYMEEYE